MINLRYYNKSIVLILTFFSLIISPLIFPSIKLFYFAPCLIILFYQMTLINALWASLAAGFLIDCLSVHSFFGLNAFVYCLTTFFLYSRRTYFFADRLTTLPLMTYLFSSCLTIILLIIASIFDKKKLLSPSIIYYDLFIMPSLDALYALVVFVWPFQLFKQAKKIR